MSAAYQAALLGYLDQFILRGPASRISEGGLSPNPGRVRQFNAGKHIHPHRWTFDREGKICNYPPPPNPLCPLAPYKLLYTKLLCIHK